MAGGMLAGIAKDALIQSLPSITNALVSGLTSGNNANNMSQLASNTLGNNEQPKVFNLAESRMKSAIEDIKREREKQAREAEDRSVYGEDTVELSSATPDNYPSYGNV